MIKHSFLFVALLLFATHSTHPSVTKGNNGTVCMQGFGCSKYISITGRNYYSNTLQIQSDALCAFEAFVENNEIVFLINGTRYDSSLKGSYYIRDNKLYNAKTHKLVRVYGQTSLAKTGLLIVAVITIGYITYILYNNGSLALLSQKALQHPYYAAAITAASLGLIAGVTYAMTR